MILTLLHWKYKREAMVSMIGLNKKRIKLVPNHKMYFTYK